MKRSIMFIVGVAAVVTLMIAITAASGLGPGSASSADAAHSGKSGPGLRWTGID